MKTRLCTFLVCFTVLATGQTKTAPATTEILWDTYGVPHIFANDNAGLFRAFGYAQMESHGDLILRLYGQARGRAAEYWGERYAASDRWVWTNSIPERAVAWQKEQTPEFARDLDAFVAGINGYAAQHGDRLAPEMRVVLPVTVADVLAHTERVILYTFVANEQTVRAQVRLSQTRSNASSQPPSGQTPSGFETSFEAGDLGSNAWAIAPKRTASGHAMLLANPHLPWEDLYLFYESQWTAPGVHLYGVTLVGEPTIAIGFNDDLGWTHTVNTINAMSVYELAPLGNGYLYEGKEKAFDVSHHPMKIKQDNGSLKEEDLVVRRSVQGPVFAESNGRLFALRVAGLDAARTNEQWWEMGRAQNLKEFEAAVSRLQLPMFNVIYADRGGHIFYLFNGAVPVRSKGDWAFWSRPVPGDSEATLWRKVHPYADLPRIADPDTGWLQNANDPPWICTYPTALDPATYPAYMSPRGMPFRPQRSVRMLRTEEAFTLDKLVAAKYSTRSEMADRILDELIATALGSDSQKAKDAAVVLAKWDRAYDAGSKGGALFGSFALRWLSGPRTFLTPWSAAYLLQTPKQIADPVRALSVLVDAAEATQSRFGAADVAWGEANRFVRDKVDLPGNGAPGALGVFRVVEFTPPVNQPGHATGGDSFVAAVEFSTPVQARVVLNYGNATQAGSPHRSDQLSLAAAKQMRVAWLSRAEVEKHLESKEPLP